MILEILAVPSCVGPGFGTLFEVPDPVGWCFQGLPDALVMFLNGFGLGFGPVWVPCLGLMVFVDFRLSFGYVFMRWPAVGRWKREWRCRAVVLSCVSCLTRSV